MKFPMFVPPRVCVTPCRITQTDGLNPAGSRRQTVFFVCICFLTQRSRQKLSAEKQLITLSGEALFNGDIAPDRPLIEGYAEIGGRKYSIYGSEKATDPDGSVNYTRLELI